MKKMYLVISGGGKIEYFGENVMEPSALKYKSSCPPGGRHTYKWTVTAQSKKLVIN